MRLRLKVSGETLGRVSVYALIIALAATFFWQLRGKQDFELLAITTALAGNTADHCPLAPEAKRAVAPDTLSICSTFGLESYLAAKRYPKIAAELFRAYGDMKEFHEVLAQHPHEALPLIEYYRTNGSAAFDMYAGFQSIMERLRGKPGVPALTKDEYGVIAIKELKRLGHELLARFELVDGVMRRNPIRSSLGVGIRLFTGGITDLEERIVRGERPTWGEVAHATLDVGIIVFGATSLITRSLKVAKATKGVALWTKVKAATSTVHTVGKITLTAGAFATLAMLVYDPLFVLSGAAWVAEQIGMWGWVGVLVLAMIVAWPVMVVLEILWRIVRYVTYPLRYTYRAGHWALLMIRRRQAREDAKKRA